MRKDGIKILVCCLLCLIVGGVKALLMILIAMMLMATYLICEAFILKNNRKKG
jgi:hypothetical protein